MGGRPNLVYSPGPGLWSLVLGPFGPELGPDLDLTWDLDLDLSLTKAKAECPFRAGLRPGYSLPQVTEQSVGHLLMFIKLLPSIAFGKEMSGLNANSLLGGSSSDTSLSFVIFFSPNFNHIVHWNNVIKLSWKRSQEFFLTIKSNKLQVVLLQSQAQKN